MVERNKRILVTALVFGLVGDVLFKDARPGMNVAIMGLAVAVAGALAARSWFWMPFAVFAVGFAFRDSDELRIANATGMIVSAGAAMASASQGAVISATVYDYTWRILAAIGSIPATFCQAIWKHFGVDLEKKIEFKKLEGPARGLILSLPFVAIFGLLFVSADARFEGWMNSLTNFDMEQAAAHLWLVVGFAVLTGGLLISVASAKPRDGITSYPFRLNISEIVTALSVINLLFIAFVICQVSYMFGGPTESSIAEYTRRGFFELVWVAGIVLTMIPIFRGVAGERRFDRKVICSLCLLVLCVFAVIASALWRMSLYVDTWGFTILRLYTSAFMVWLTLTFIWLFVTLLRRDENRFAFGSLVTGFACILALNAVNPDALIARTNLEVTTSADYPMLSKLSVDAKPIIEQYFDRFSNDQQAAIQRKWRRRIESGWRSTNASLLSVGGE